MAIEKEIGECLRARHLTMGTAESCTGGYIAHLITRVAGQFRLLLRGSRFLQQ